MGFDGKGFVGEILKLINVVGPSMMTREKNGWAGAAHAPRWPEGRVVLRQKGASDSMLIDLCESYELACAAAYWSKSDAPRAVEIADECRFLISELEFEARERASVAARITVTSA